MDDTAPTAGRRWTEGKAMYEELMKRLREATGWKNASEHYSLMKEAADAIEELQNTVVHGRWIELGKYRDGYNWRCSVCKRESFMARNYCPFCGAKMDEEDE